MCRRGEGGQLAGQQHLGQFSHVVKPDFENPVRNRSELYEKNNILVEKKPFIRGIQLWLNEDFGYNTGVSILFSNVQFFKEEKCCQICKW